MRSLHTSAEYEKAVSPIIAILLLLAITVVLASVMYVTISQMMPSTPQNPRPLGIVVQRAGNNWIIEVAVVSAGVSPRYVYLGIVDPNGTTILHYTPIANLTGFQDEEPKDTLSAGDRILVPLQTYPVGSTVTIKDDQRILYQGVLKV